MLKHSEEHTNSGEMTWQSLEAEFQGFSFRRRSKTCYKYEQHCTYTQANTTVPVLPKCNELLCKSTRVQLWEWRQYLGLYTPVRGQTREKNWEIHCIGEHRTKRVGNLQPRLLEHY